MCILKEQNSKVLEFLCRHQHYGNKCVSLYVRVALLQANIVFINNTQLFSELFYLFIARIPYHD